MSEIIEVRYSDREEKFGIVTFDVINGIERWAWLSKHAYDKYYIHNDSDFEADIPLFDYFEDILNPTETELSLLELEHSIRYIKD